MLLPTLIICIVWPVSECKKVAWLLLFPVLVVGMCTIESGTLVAWLPSQLSSRLGACFAIRWATGVLPYKTSKKLYFTKHFAQAVDFLPILCLFGQNNVLNELFSKILVLV